MAKSIREIFINVRTNAAASMNKGTAAATGLGGAIKGVNTAAMAATGGIRAMAMALVSTGVGAVVVAIGTAVAAMMALTKNSMKFATVNSELQALLGKNGTAGAMEALSEDAQRLGSKTEWTATQVAELQATLARGGFNPSEIVDATESVLALASATGIGLEEAAAQVSTTLKAMGLTTAETARVVDVLALTANSSTQNVTDLGESMKISMPIAKGLGIDIETLASSLGILANNGLKGSIAGTGLNRVMSELNKKFGGDFMDNLERFNTEINKFESESQKMIYIEETVGRIGIKSAPALVNSIEQILELKGALDESSGSAEYMAAVRLDNLQGDLTMLGSAAQGFALRLEDGDGALTQVARGGVALLGVSLKVLENVLQVIGVAINLGVIVPFKKAWNAIQTFGAISQGVFNKMQQTFYKLKIAAADIPFIGKNIDKEAAEAQLEASKKAGEQYLENLKALSEEAKKIDKDAIESTLKTGANMKAVWTDKGKTQAKLDAEAEQEAATKAEREKQEAITEEQREAEAKRLEDKKTLIDKLRKMEEDAEDITATDKINRKRDRHLKELHDTVKNVRERNELEAEINKLYDDQIDKLEAKEEQDKLDKQSSFLDKLNNQFEDAEAKTYADRQQLAMQRHLDEIDRVVQDEEAKQIAKAGVIAMYAERMNKYEAEKAAADVKREESALQESQRRQRQAGTQALDALAHIAGEESKIAKMAHAGKLALQLVELKESMSFELKKLAVKGAVAANDVQSGFMATLKAGMPQSGILVAAYAVQAAAMMMAFRKSQRKTAAVLGGSSSSSGMSSTPVAAPSFNVLGATSAGDNMIANTISGVNDNPVRAYVLEGDVSSAQSAARNTSDLASVG